MPTNTFVNIHSYRFSCSYINSQLLYPVFSCLQFFANIIIISWTLHCHGYQMCFNMKLQLDTSFHGNYTMFIFLCISINHTRRVSVASCAHFLYNLASMLPLSWLSLASYTILEIYLHLIAGILTRHWSAMHVFKAIAS